MLYRKLRGALRENDLDAEYLADKLGISRNTLSRRMTAKPNSGWTLDEAYAVLKLLNLPPWKIPEYFPPGGMAV